MSRAGLTSVASLAVTLLACGQDPIKPSRTVEPDAGVDGPFDQPFACVAWTLPGERDRIEVFVGSGWPGPLWYLPRRAPRRFGDPELVADSVLWIRHLGDLDGDGNAEVGLAEERDGAGSISYGTLDPSGYVRTSSWEIDGSAFSHLAAVGDWTGNGHVDVAITGSADFRSWRPSVLEGSPTGPHLPPVWSGDRRLSTLGGATDADGDGRNEIALGDYGWESWLFSYGSDGSVAEQQLPFGRLRPIGDVDGDGRTDFSRTVWPSVSTPRASAEVYLGPVEDIEPWWRFEGWIDCVERPDSTCVDGVEFVYLQSLDFNGDGHRDLLLAARAPAGPMARGFAAVFEGRKGRAPKRKPTWVLAAPNDPRGFDVMRPADLDGDGMDDVLAVASDCPSREAPGGKVYFFFGREQRP